MIPTTRTDVWKRSAVRLVFCAIVYLVIAWLWSLQGDNGLFHSFWFWWCIVLIPGGGLVLDLWRLRQT